MIEAGNVQTTKAAREGGATLGFDFDSMIEVVMTLTPADFYKSMTTLQTIELARPVPANHDTLKNKCRNFL